MKICLISRQFSRFFDTKSDFQIYFSKINSFYPKLKTKMSDNSNQSKTRSSDETIEEKRQKRERVVSNTNSCQSGSHDNRSAEEWPQMNENFSADSDINSYTFSVPYCHHQAICAPILPFGIPDPFMRQSAYSRYRYIPKQSLNYSHSSHRNRYFSQFNRRQTDDEFRELVLRNRRMIQNKSSDDMGSDKFSFSIMTYNILSQNLMEDHSSLYQHCLQSDLIWPKRGETLIKELLDSDTDIICLQEVHSQHFDEILMPALKQRGYNFVFKQRTGGKLDGCAIVYKENKFTLLNAIKLDLMRKDLSSLLDRDNIALIAELKPKDSGNDSKPLIVANTHLLYNPRRGDVKLAQIRLILAEIEKMAHISQKDGVFDYNPIILCGDLNSEPNSMIYDFITKGMANFGGLNMKIGDISGQRDGFGKGRLVEDYHLELMGVSSDTRYESPPNKANEVTDKMCLKHNFKLRSVISRFEDKFGNKLISTSNYYASGLVDYIFYDYKNLKLRAFQRLLTRRKIEEMGSIPNSVLGSDHLSIKSVFSII